MSLGGRASTVLLKSPSTESSSSEGGRLSTGHLEREMGECGWKCSHHAIKFCLKGEKDESLWQRVGGWLKCSPNVTLVGIGGRVVTGWLKPLTNER